MNLLLLALAVWIPQASGTKSSLRGVVAVSSKVAWAGGTKGTVLKTLDGGKHWTPSPVPGAEALDFRDVESFDGRTVTILDKSRLYRITDGGAHWTLLLSNPDPAGFFDAIAFFTKRSGLLLGDPLTAVSSSIRHRTAPRGLAAPDPRLYPAKAHLPPAGPA